MRSAAGLLLSVVAGLGAAHAQPTLTAKDYDDFYARVVQTAKNGSKDEWLSSYDAVVDFIARVRQDVERLPEATQRSLAKAVHDNGYWKGQEVRVRDPQNPFLGSRFTAADDALRTVLTPQGFAAYRNRYAQGAGGFRFTLEAVANRRALYTLEGKDVPGVAELPASTNIINANAQSWDDLVVDAQRYPNPGERLAVITRNQLNAIASALALLRGSKTRSDEEMDYATAVIWRYTGHYSGKDGWDKEVLVRTPYDRLPAAERVKDRPMWQAVRDVMKR